MKTFNTLLLIQTDHAEGQSEVQEQVVIQQDEQPVQQTFTEQPVPTTEKNSAPEGNKWVNYLFILLIIVVFYFFLIRPQSKRAKEERKFRESLKKGDKIVTSAGIHGKLLEIDETTVVIETEGQGKLRIEKVAIIKNQSA